MFTIEYKGYKISQSSNNHVFIFKNGKMVFHASCSVKYKEENLKEILEFYLKLLDDEE
ncbi:MAG: hypothetical protein MR405_07765 [Mollicutes bacterium]|nr:hypothetical protein [Mollicutes bacterium]